MKGIYKLFVKHDIDIEEDVCEYGITVLKRYTSIIVFVLPLVGVCDIFLESISFIFLFSLIRHYLGGYHFDNNVLCFIFSVCSAIGIPLLSIQYHISIYLLLILSLSNFVIISIVGPIDHMNKMLSNIEKAFFKKKAMYIETTAMAISFILNLFLKSNFSSLIMYTVTFHSISILFALLKRLIYEKRNL